MTYKKADLMLVVVKCLRHKSHYSWQLFRNNTKIDLQAYSYQTMWAAEQAGKTTLELCLQGFGMPTPQEASK